MDANSLLGHHLKRRSFSADLAKIKHVSMHMCHLTAKTKRGV